MYSRILVPLDGSKLAEQVLPYIKFFGEKLDSKVVVLQVLPGSPDAGAEGVQDAHTYNRFIENVLQKDELKASSKVAFGDAAKQIIIEANSEPGTLIVMSTRGHSGLEPGVLGSVVEAVLEGTSNPLLIIRSQPEDTFPRDIRLETLIVPLDGSPLAEFSLPYVIHLAQTGGLRVKLVRATPIAGRQDLLLEYPDGHSDSALLEIDTQAKTYLRSIAEELRKNGALRVEEEVLHGAPAVAIVEFALTASNNMVVMTTHGSSGMGPWPLGSVTQLVGCHCETPVLVIRPDGQNCAR